MDPQLSALARARGVATWYENADRQRVDVAEDVVRAVLDEMGPPTPSTTQVVTEGPDTRPLGYHQLDDGRELIVTPRRLPAVEPAWGWMLQLYALHSAGSWGIGDFADLREFTRRSGAGIVLVNPVQAITPALPVRRSPYSPSSRRFANPIYLRVTETDEFRAADPATREQVLRLAPPSTDLIDYDAVWTAKLAALE